MGIRSTPTTASKPMIIRLQKPARISHQPSIATAQLHVLTGVRSVRVLDMVLTMPARSSITNTSQDIRLSRLATNAGEKCGLARYRSGKRPDLYPPCSGFFQRAAYLSHGRRGRRYIVYQRDVHAGDVFANIECGAHIFSSLFGG